jgi:hypothetical protein
MKRYSVVYLVSAEAALASIWENAPDRSKVTNAADMADAILASSPEDRSVFLSEDLRKLDVAPVRFYFTIREDDRLVEVTKVIYIG